MKEMGMLLIYPLIYGLFCTIMLATRIYTYVHTAAKPSDIDHSLFNSLWLLHSIADPGRIILPALAFLLHPYVWKIFFRQPICPCRPPDDAVSAYTMYSVSPEGSDISEGISIQPTGDDYGSVNNRESVFLN